MRNLVVNQNKLAVYELYYCIGNKMFCHPQWVCRSEAGRCFTKTLVLHRSTDPDPENHRSSDLQSGRLTDRQNSTTLRRSNSQRAFSSFSAIWHQPWTLISITDRTTNLSQESNTPTHYIACSPHSIIASSQSPHLYPFGRGYIQPDHRLLQLTKIDRWMRHISFEPMAEVSSFYFLPL